MNNDDHYLKIELYDKIQNDPKLFEWFEQGSLDGIWYWDLQDGEQEWLSPKFQSMFGYQPNEIPHTSAWWQENIFPEDLALAQDNFNKHLADPNHPYDQIVRYKHKSGSIVWVRCRGLIIRDDNGTAIRMLGAHSDVTSLKVIEQELNDKQEELERSNAELEQFAFLASHDLKSPLIAMGQLISWIEEDCEGLLPDTSKEYFDLLKGRALRMGNLLDDLLEYSRVGRFNFNVETVEIDTLAEKVFSLLNSKNNFVLKVKGATIEIQKIPLEIVLRNLISNSIKHHDKESGNIEIGCELLTDGYKIYVKDDGPGILPKLQERAFGMFQTLKPRDQVEGSGMGLAYIKKTVELYGGNINIDSDGIRGFCCNIYWPLSVTK